jgi:hypothetical protein
MLVLNSTLIATNINNSVTNLANPFVRGFYYSRTPGTADLYNVDIYYSDAGSTNPAYGVAEDFGLVPYTGRNLLANGCRLNNIRFHSSCTNPLSANFLITGNNAIILGGTIANADGTVLTVYNPTNYTNPFNFASSFSPTVVSNVQTAAVTFVGNIPATSVVGIQAGNTNVTLVGATAQTISFPVAMPSTNYVVNLTDNGGLIPGLAITSYTTTNFVTSMTALTFTGNLTWSIIQMSPRAGGP